MSEIDNGGIWPPPPTVLSEEVEPPPKPPRVTDRSIGRVSLGLSILGSLCALACVLLFLLVAPHGHWFYVGNTLEFGSGGCFIAAFFVGFVGWFSWEGKLGLALAVVGPPFWFVAALVVDAQHGP